MKIRLHPEDCARYGVGEVIDFDETRIGLREGAAMQKATGMGPDGLGAALQADEPDLEALAMLVWLAIGRTTGTRPDWATFDVGLINIEGEVEPGKASTPAKTSKPRSAAGRQRSRTT